MSSGGTELDKLIVRFQAQFDDLRREFKVVRDDAKETAGSIRMTYRQLGNELTSIGLKLSTAVTVPLAVASMAAVKTASDIEEANNLMRQTYGDNTEAVQEWATATAKAMGRSRFELQRFAGDFAAFLKPSGVQDNALVPMSEALSQLVVDIASFRNLSEQDVFIKLLAGLAGEAEGLKRLGVVISETALKEEARRQGIKKNVEAMTELEKISLRFTLIVRQTADAQGDAERTSSSLTNLWRRLSAVAVDLANDLGSRLIPTAKMVVGIAIDMTQSFLDLPEAVKGSVVTFGLIAAAAGPGILALGLLTKATVFAYDGFMLLARNLPAIMAGIRAKMIGFAAFMTAPLTVTLAVTSGMLLAWTSFRSSTITILEGTISAMRTTLVGGFTNQVHRPLAQKVNELIEMLPAGFVKAFNKMVGAYNAFLDKVPFLMRGTLFPGLAKLPDLQMIPEKIEIPEEVKTDLADEMKDMMGRARESFAKEKEQFKTDISEFGEYVKSFLPKGVGDSIAGMFGGGDKKSGVGGMSQDVQSLYEQWLKLNGAIQDTTTSTVEHGKKSKDALKTVDDAIKAIRDAVERQRQETIRNFETLKQSVRKPEEEYRDTIAALDEMRTQLLEIGISGEDVEETLTRAADEAGKKFKDAKRNIQEATEPFKAMQSIAKDVGSSLEEAFTSGITEGKKFGDVMMDIGNAIFETFVKNAIMKPIVGAMTAGLFGEAGGGTGGGLFGNLFGSAKGNVFRSGTAVPFSRGGSIVNGLSFFPMSNGKTGMMGEGGKEEGIFPLYRTSRGELGVRAAGGGGGGGGNRVQVIVHTPPGSSVQQSQQQSGDLTRLTLMIDNVTAQNLQSPGSKTFRAMKSSFGAQPTVGG